MLYTIKYKVDRLLERCKVRLVAKEYTTTYGFFFFLSNHEVS